MSDDLIPTGVPVRVIPPTPHPHELGPIRKRRKKSEIEEEKRRKTAVANLRALERERDKRVSEDVIKAMFDEKGKLNDAAKTLVQKQRNTRSFTEQVLARELVLMVWNATGKNLLGLQKAFDITFEKAKKEVYYAYQPLREDKEAFLQHQLNEVKLENVRFENMKKLIDELYNTVAKAHKRVQQELPNMRGTAALAVFDKTLTKALQLSGHAASKAGRLENSGKPTEELQAEATDLDAKLKRLKVVEGGNG